MLMLMLGFKTELAAPSSQLYSNIISDINSSPLTTVDFRCIAMKE